MAIATMDIASMDIATMRNRKNAHRNYGFIAVVAGIAAASGAMA